MTVYNIFHSRIAISKCQRCSTVTIELCVSWNGKINCGFHDADGGDIPVANFTSPGRVRVLQCDLYTTKRERERELLQPLNFVHICLFRLSARSVVFLCSFFSQKRTAGNFLHLTCFQSLYQHKDSISKEILLQLI